MFLVNMMKNWVSNKLSLPTGFFLVLFGLILCIVIPNFSQIESKLGFITKADLQKQVIQQQASIEEAKQANDEMVNEADNQKQIGNAKVDSVTHVIDAKQKNETITGKIIRTKDNTIASIKKKLKPSSAVAVKDQEAEQVSEVQITAIWEVYCQFNQDNACSKQAS